MVASLGYSRGREWRESFRAYRKSCTVAEMLEQKSTEYPYNLPVWFFAAIE